MTFIIVGRVTRGKGEAGGFICLDWVKTQIVEKMGFEPYDGTLNLELIHPDVEVYRRHVFWEGGGVEIVPVEGGYKFGILFKVTINDVEEGAIVVPLVEGYPQDKVEIIAEKNLREALGLKDSSEVKITFLDG